MRNRDSEDLTSCNLKLKKIFKERRCLPVSTLYGKVYVYTQTVTRTCIREEVFPWGEILPAPLSEQIPTDLGRAKLQQLSVHVVGPCASAQAGTL